MIGDHSNTGSTKTSKRETALRGHFFAAKKMVAINRTTEVAAQPSTEMGIIKKLTIPGSPQTSMRRKTIPGDAKAGQKIHRSIFTTQTFRSSSIITPPL
jgi:hypothetical protein